MEQNTSWEASSYLGNQEIPHILYKSKVCYHAKISPPLSPAQSTISHTVSLRFLLILSSSLRLVFPNGRFPSGFPTKISYAFRISPMRAPCPFHILFDLITLIIYDETYKLWRSSLCSLLRLPSTSSLLDPNILFNALSSNTLSLSSSLGVRD